VYQSVLGGIQQGAYREYDRVVVHTAKDCEAAPEIDGVSYCFCMRYQRGGPHVFRAVVSLMWVMLRLIPHVIRVASTSQGWEVQGLFGKYVFVLLIAIPRLLRNKVTWVPHNSFSRAGGRLEVWAQRLSSRLCNELVVFVDSEAPKFPFAKAVIKRRLFMFTVDVSSQVRERWRLELESDLRPVILFVGQLRSDKNPRMLLEAVNGLDFACTLVFAGQDKGALDSIHAFRLASIHTLVVESRYLDISDFQGLMRISDLIVCPYAVASQSAVLALASQFGVSSIASDVGGLSEQADRVFELDSVDPVGRLRALISSSLEPKLTLLANGDEK